MKPTKTRRGPGLSLSKPFWNAHPQAPHMKNRVSVIYGLSSGPAVDVSIADLVLRMNEVGLVTNFCCSGLNKDHRGQPGQVAGYISFVHPVPKALALLLGDYLESRTLIRVYHYSEKHVMASWALVGVALEIWASNKCQ